MPEHDDRGEYNNDMPKSAPVPKGSGGGGYPNNDKNTQTVKKRGTGAATKGTHCSTNLA